MDHFFNIVGSSVVGLANEACNLAQVAAQQIPNAVAGLARNAQRHGEELLHHLSAAADTIALNFLRATFVAKNLPYSHFGARLLQWTSRHRWRTVLFLAGAATVVAPGLITLPLMNLAGFSGGGVVAGSLAAAIQSILGPIAAGSLFAILQSAAMGGLGLAAVNLFVQVVAAGLVAGTSMKPVMDALSNNAVAAVMERRPLLVQRRMIAGVPTNDSHGGAREEGEMEDSDEEK